VGQIGFICPSCKVGIITAGSPALIKLAEYEGRDLEIEWMDEIEIDATKLKINNELTNNDKT